MRATLVIITLLIAAGTLTEMALAPIDSAATNTACSRYTAVSLTDLRHTELFSCVDRLFNARFPYRDTLRRVKAWVDYYLFRSSPVPLVHVGPNGWLNYRNELGDYQKDACSREQAMKDLARQLHELEEVIEASGRRFVAIIAPNKSTIYPEYVGLSRSPTCGKSAYDLLLDAFGEYPVKQFLRLDDLLLEAKRQNPVYYKTDTHWNEVGALIVTRTLLQRLAPDTWRGYLGEVAMTTSRHSSDLRYIMGLDLSEMAPIIQTKSRQTTSTEDRLPNALNISHTRIGPVAVADRSILPGAVFFRDSFMNVPLEILGGAFAQIDSYWTEGGEIRIPMPGSENALKISHIIVLEAVERNLTYLHIDVRAFADALRD